MDYFQLIKSKLSINSQQISRNTNHPWPFQRRGMRNPLERRKYLTMAESNSPPMEGLGVVNSHRRRLPSFIFPATPLAQDPSCVFY